YGFPLDLTQDVLRGRGLKVDSDGFEDAMANQRATGKANWKGSGDAGSLEVWAELADRLGPTRFTGYAAAEGEGELLAIVKDAETVDSASEGALELVFDETPFYAESGGQSGDHGVVKFKSGPDFTVTDVQKRGGGLHVLVGALKSGKGPGGERAGQAVQQ
ncbi:MAG TPA: alanine--tRNA ligase, partial [Hyphomonadaceae bacterium]|nr:alanine--tRNA ligase [Hyphomonadaceae bacterium]